MLDENSVAVPRICFWMLSRIVKHKSFHVRYTVLPAEQLPIAVSIVLTLLWDRMLAKQTQMDAESHIQNKDEKKAG